MLPKVSDDMKPKSAQLPVTYKGHLSYPDGTALLVTTTNLTNNYNGS